MEMVLEAKDQRIAELEAEVRALRERLAAEGGTAVDTGRVLVISRHT